MQAHVRVAHGSAGTRARVAALAVLLLLQGAAVAAAHERVPILHQGQMPACVAFAAAAVAQFHGYAVDPLALQRAVPVTPNGVAYADVVAVLVRWGVTATLLTASTSQVRGKLAAGLPMVVGQATERGDHAIVVESYDGARGIYEIMDPAHPGARERDARSVDAAFEQAGRRALLIGAPARPN